MNNDVRSMGMYNTVCSNIKIPKYLDNTTDWIIKPACGNPIKLTNSWLRMLVDQ